MSSPRAGVLVVVAYDSGSRGNPLLRGRTAALAAAVADGARAVEKTRVLDMRLGERDPDWCYRPRYLTIRRHRSMSTVRPRSMTTALTAPPSWPILTGRSTAVSDGETVNGP
jgi:hypothetical protein